MRGCTVGSLFTPQELVLEKEWLEVRDILIGMNVEQDVKRALELASIYQHPHTQWLADVFAGKTVCTAAEARAVFLADKKNLPASLCLAALLGKGPEDEALLRRSSDLGWMFARLALSKGKTEEECFQIATAAVLQRERLGFRLLGVCFEFGKGCEKDVEKAKENFLIAAELGDVTAMERVGLLSDESDPQRWIWWGQAAKLGSSFHFLRHFGKQVQLFDSGSGSAAAVFQIGQSLNGHVDVVKRRIFCDSDDFDYRIIHANTSIMFYNAQLAACRQAVETWSLCAVRLGIVKDVWIFIGKLIWELRDLALFKIDATER